VYKINEDDSICNDYYYGEDEDERQTGREDLESERGRERYEFKEKDNVIEKEDEPTHRIYPSFVINPNIWNNPFIELNQKIELNKKQKSKLEEESKSDSILNVFSNLLTLSNSLSKKDNSLFMKVYECFESYFKYYVQTITALNSNTKKARIIVVDDDRVMLSSLVRNINSCEVANRNYVDEDEKSCFEAIAAKNGIEALNLYLMDNYINNDNLVLKAIISDQSMPFMNGIELFNQIKNNDPSTKVKFYLSSSDFDLSSANKKNFTVIEKGMSKENLSKLLSKLE